MVKVETSGEEESGENKRKKTEEAELANLQAFVTRQIELSSERKSKT